jgi:excinuclease ABC subunit B
MVRGDRSRKDTLIAYGFRLPSARDNRPLTFEEFLTKVGPIIFTSATPGPWELRTSKRVKNDGTIVRGYVEQLIRPTGLLDPTIEVRPTKDQLRILTRAIEIRVKRGERTLVTTLTKRLAEELAAWLSERGIRVEYLHADIETLERPDILHRLRSGEIDVLVGINLLREGLDLPEVSLVAILDADQEGFLRNETTLIQTMGRAARHVHGHVILFADTITASMRKAIGETKRRRRIQQSWNRTHRITPRSIEKAVEPSTLIGRHDDDHHLLSEHPATTPELIRDLRREMAEAAKRLDFERAAKIRDLLKKLLNDEKRPR